MSVTMYNLQEFNAKAELWKAKAFQILKLTIFHQPGKVLSRAKPHAIWTYHNFLLNVSCHIRSETSQSLQYFSATKSPLSPTRNDARDPQSPLVRLASKASFQDFVLFLFLAQIYPNYQVRTKKRLVHWPTVMVLRRGTLYKVNPPVLWRSPELCFFLGGSKPNSCPRTILDAHKSWNDDV